MRAGKLSPRGNVVRRLATPRPSSIFLLDHLAEHFNRGGECPLSGGKADPRRTSGMFHLWNHSFRGEKLAILCLF
jgi:hypothetical protein